MQCIHRMKTKVKFLALLLLFPLCISPAFAVDSTAMVNQIKKSFSTVKRHIVTQPQKAATELSETMALLEELKAVEPANSHIPLLERRAEKLNAELAKRLGKDVKAVSRTPAVSIPKTPVVAAPSPSLAPATVTPVTSNAGSSAKLPSGVTSRIKKIDQSLQKAQKALDNESLQRAELELKSANKFYDEIQQRYKADAPVDHPAMVDVAARMAAVNIRIESVANADAEEEAVKVAAETANKALAESWIAQMTPFLNRESPRYLDQTGWGKESADFTRIRQSYAEAATVFADYQKVDFSSGKPMQLRNSENALRSVLDNLRETYAKEDRAKASEEWLAKLEPFVTSMGTKILIVSFTSSVEQMESQKSIFNEASQLFEQYLKADFPLGKSPALQKVEEELADRLAKFPETMQQSMSAKAGNAEQKLEQEIAFLQSKQEWRDDSSKRPYYLSDARINEARKLVDTAAGLLPAGDPGLARIEEKMASLIQMNNERRTVNAERTRMMPDTFGGAGKDDIKQTAEGLVTAKISGCKVLRSTVISEDWKEESVREWTDTTQTAVRFRTTRSVRSQVAAKKTDGEVRLYTVYIAKDLRADGSWSKLYGNLQSDLGDLILAENVNK